MEKIATLDVINMPIPPIKSVFGWKQIEIDECGEPLIELNMLAPGLIIVDAQYHNRQIRHASDTLYARESVSERLAMASRMLPEEHRLLIWDAWRPLEVQQALFDSYLEELRKLKSDMPEETLEETAQAYVSLPSSDPCKPSPHYTGGAVDLTIMGPDEMPLLMGTEFDHFGEEASTLYFENRPLQQGEKLLRNNRRLLYHTMVNADFSGYDEEWWHFDFGNQFDAARTGKTNAIFGPTAGVNLVRR
jgi:D-alanyl-D-alanine dipeptidase